MKGIYIFTALFFSLSLLLIHANSFSTAEVRNQASLLIGSEENALISISYRQNTFAITNNTENVIAIKSIDLLNHSAENIMNLTEKDSISILPGREKEFTVTGNVKELAGKTLQIIVRWKGGSAEIKSTIPERFGE